MSKDQSGPAFPCVDANRPMNGGMPGISVRDYFAAHAPEAPDDFAWNNGESTYCQRLIRWRYFYADSMIAARNAGAE